MNNTLKWLSAIGVEYCCYEHLPKLKVSNNTKLTEKPQVKLMPEAKIKSDTHDNIVNSVGFGYKEQGAKPITNRRTTSDNVGESKSIDYIALARALADKANNIEELRKSLQDFNGCELKKFATNTVFGDGNPEAKIMLIGEAPGSTEDLKGIPFCGESGNLLDNMLHAIGVSRKNNAYITNTVFWRPPANRQPTLEEVDICRPFVEKHIALINPKLIILVGSTAATSLLGKNSGITKIRQEYYFYSNKYLSSPIQTTAIFHPAYLLRQPTQKRTSWYDLLKIKDYLVKNNLVAS
jgi:uracil-DNA glycosylase family 4